MTDIEVWHAAGYELAEGGRRIGGRLMFVDILSGRLFECPAREPGAGRLVAQLDVPLGAVAPIVGRPGSWIGTSGSPSTSV